jgi:hypothetical protein
VSFEPEDMSPVRVRRPKTRADCADVERPCPFVACKWNLYLDSSPSSGSITFNFPSREPDEMPPNASCALDVADLGGATLEAVADYMNLTREAIRQTERRVQRSLQVGMREYKPAGADDRGNWEGRMRFEVVSPFRKRHKMARVEYVDEPADEPNSGGHPIGLSNAELREAAVFGSIAGAYILAGVPARVAWDRANEWMAANPGRAPEWVEVVAVRILGVDWREQAFRDLQKEETEKGQWPKATSVSSTRVTQSTGFLATTPASASASWTYVPPMISSLTTTSIGTGTVFG